MEPYKEIVFKSNEKKELFSVLEKEQYEDHSYLRNKVWGVKLILSIYTQNLQITN
jgi:hypothetical protein